jgi:uncharacterized membrane protein YqiK
VGIGILAGTAVVAVVVLVVLFRSLWRVAEPNEALVISGFRHGDTGEGLGFKIVTGKGVAVIPGFQQVRRLSLDLREAQLAIDCVTHQGIPVGIKGASSTSRTSWRRGSTTSSPATSAPSSAT